MKSSQEQREKLRRTMREEGFVCDECAETFAPGASTDYYRPIGKKIVPVCEPCGDEIKAEEEEQEFFGSMSFTGGSD